MKTADLSCLKPLAKSRSPIGREILSAGLIVAVLFLAGVARAETIDAIWKTHRVIFQYSGGNTAYSCDALRAKLRAILQRVGAHPDMRVVTASSCNEVSGDLTFNVLFRTPVPATEANLQTATGYDAREVLAARVRGEQLATLEDVERFPAEWRTIALSRDFRLGLGPSDCALMQQVASELFSQMSVHTISQSVCSPWHSYTPRLTVTALVRASNGGSR